MNIADHRRLFDFDDWANARLFHATTALTDEQYYAPAVSSFPSVAATVGHVVGAEWIWLRRFHGISPAEAPDWAARSPLHVLREILREVQRERTSWLDSVTEAMLVEMLDYRNLAGEAKSLRLGDVLTHVVNHSTYHRGQLTTLLRQHGLVPPATDFMVYASEKRD